jgi:hypothetical protein
MKRPRENIPVGADVMGIDAAEDSKTSRPLSSASYLRKNKARSIASPSSKHPNKRPRTEQYLREVKKLDVQGKVVHFFQQRLQSLRKKSDDSHSSSDAMTQILQQILHKKWELQQQQFQEFRQGMVENAQRRIHLKNGIQSMQRYLQDPSGPNCSPSTICPLEKLQQGEETTSALFDLIADYAGFPSEGETEDCQCLMAVAGKMNQA